MTSIDAYAAARRDTAARDALLRVRRALRHTDAAQVLAVLDVLLDPRRGGHAVVLEALDNLVADR